MRPRRRRSPGPENVHIPASRDGLENRDPADRTVSALGRPIPSIRRDLGGMMPDPGAPRCRRMAASEKPLPWHAADMPRESAAPARPRVGVPGNQLSIVTGPCSKHLIIEKVVQLLPCKERKQRCPKSTGAPHIVLISQRGHQARQTGETPTRATP